MVGYFLSEDFAEDVEAVAGMQQMLGDCAALLDDHAVIVTAIADVGDVGN